MLGKCFCPSSSDFFLSQYIWHLCEMDTHLSPILQIESQSTEKLQNCLGSSGYRIKKWWGSLGGNSENLPRHWECSSVESIQEALSSIPSSTQIGMVAHTCNSNLRQEDQKFEASVGYMKLSPKSIIIPTPGPVLLSNLVFLLAWGTCSLGSM